MQSINEMSNVSSNDLISAQQLQEMTATPEDLFNMKKEDLLVNLMSSMVGVATKNGAYTYQARMTADYDTAVLDAIQSELNGLGYNVSYEPSKFTVEGREIDIIVLNISWEAQ